MTRRYNKTTVYVEKKKQNKKQQQQQQQQQNRKGEMSWVLLKLMIGIFVFWEGGVVRRSILIG